MGTYRKSVSNYELAERPGVSETGWHVPVVIRFDCAGKYPKLILEAGEKHSVTHNFRNSA